MNFKDNETQEKLRGGYYTPLPIAQFLTSWALQQNTEKILEPSCGDGVFLEAIAKIIKRRSLKNSVIVDAIELFPKEAKKARERINFLKSDNIKFSVENKDFFKWIISESNVYWDAILGNPPYIRYQYFDGNQRDRAKVIFQLANVPFSKRTNAWVPFVVAGVMRLKPGGRIAMVIPPEIQYILHADGLRRLLEQEMEEITIIHLKEMVFKNILQGVVLFLGVKRKDRKFLPLTDLAGVGNKTKLRISEVSGIEELGNFKFEKEAKQTIESSYDGKWMKALLSPSELNICDKIEKCSPILRFADIADVDIGIVTGANSFFVVNKELLAKYKLNILGYPMLAKSALIRGIIYTKKDHTENMVSGKPVFFLDFNKYRSDRHPKNIQQYLKIGEEKGLPKRYKCRIRDPWYNVPYIWKSEVSMLKRCHIFPRLVLNKLGAFSTDTAYRIKMKPQYKGKGKNFVFSFINSLTFLYAELGGRHYGGGVLELVPSEIEKLYIPLYKCTDLQFNELDRLIRQKAQVNRILDHTDFLVLGSLGFSRKEIRKIRSAWHRLRERRHRV